LRVLIFRYTFVFSKRKREEESEPTDVDKYEDYEEIAEK